jgi:hypothetical protein
MPFCTSWYDPVPNKLYDRYVLQHRLLYLIYGVKSPYSDMDLRLIQARLYRRVSLRVTRSVRSVTNLQTKGTRHATSSRSKRLQGYGSIRKRE